MNIKRTLALTGMGFLTVAVVSYFQISPGYMDADYYYATALRIANGHGLSEPFLWNYLAGFSALPHPSHAYWMPLTTFLSVAGLIITGSEQFNFAQTGFITLAALVPPFTAHLAYQMTEEKRTAILAGLMACFPIFYLPYLPTTDSFSPYMFLGGMYFYFLGRDQNTGYAPFTLGLLAGVLHLTRTEGVLWIALGVVSLYLRRAGIKPYLLLLAGYVLVFGPWMTRNLVVFGSPFGAGGLRALWLTSYDQLFVFPPEKLNFQGWWGRGLGPIVGDRWWAAGINLQTLVAIQGQLFMLPLTLWGCVKLWRKHQVRMGVLAWALLFTVMTAVFPFPGARGGFFHSGAALQPLIWTLAAVGFGEFVKWGVKTRSWKRDQAWRILGSGLILILVGTTFWLTRDRVIGGDFRSPKWNESYYQQVDVEKTLQELDAKVDDLVMVNNPPGNYLVSRRQSIVIPAGEVEMLLAAADKYGADYVILDKNVPRGLADLYEQPRSIGELRYLQSERGVHYFKIERNHP